MASSTAISFWARNAAGLTWISVTDRTASGTPLMTFDQAAGTVDTVIAPTDIHHFNGDANQTCSGSGLPDLNLLMSDGRARP